MSPLVRIGDAEDIAQDMIITSVMDYSCTIFDNSADRSRNFIDVEPDLIVEYKSESSRPAAEPDKTYLIDWNKKSLAICEALILEGVII